MITINEVVDTLKPINNNFFHIPDLMHYADKIVRLGKSLVKRKENLELLSYILYYDNGSEAFIKMVWTNPEHQGKGLAKNLLMELIKNSSKDIRLEVNINNPAKNLYRSLKFKEESRNETNITMFYSKRLSIMQPYVFPYIGYFHLIESADKIVFYDDVNYLKRGWINRNKILVNNAEYLFTFPVVKASQNKLINEIVPLADDKFKDKFLSLIAVSYKKAPYYNEVKDLVSKVLHQNSLNAADLAINSIVEVYGYLNRELNWTKSSTCSGETKGMDKAERLIRITTDLGYKKYINAIGGQEIYSKEYFRNRGVQLNFVQSNKIEYKQFNQDFIPWLSIIDILMFNDKKAVVEKFAEYSIV